MSYYERWISAIANTLLQRGVSPPTSSAARWPRSGAGDGA